MRSSQGIGIVRRIRADMSASRLAAALCLVLASACSIDDRTLITTMGNGGAANRAGSGSRPSGGSSGGGGVSSDAGQAGDMDQGGSPPAVLDGCADLDLNSTPDCMETLVDNAAFESNVTGWTAELDASIGWNARDLLGLPHSGSALVTSSKTIDALGDSVVAASQCIAVPAGDVIEVYANAFIEASDTPGRASIGLWFYSTAECAGTSASEVFATSEEFATETLITLHGARGLPEHAKSVRVRLGVIKPFKAEKFEVRFDNVLVRVD